MAKIEKSKETYLVYNMSGRGICLRTICATPNFNYVNYNGEMFTVMQIGEEHLRNADSVNVRPIFKMVGTCFVGQNMDK